MIASKAHHPRHSNSHSNDDSKDCNNCRRAVGIDILNLAPVYDSKVDSLLHDGTMQKPFVSLSRRPSTPNLTCSLKN